MQEEWKKIKEEDYKPYGGHYEVSNLGNFRHYIYWRKTYVPMNSYLTKNTFYYRISLRITKKNKIRPVRIHRLIAEYFVDNPLKLNNVHHKDENRFNNVSTNLQWVDKMDHLYIHLEENQKKGDKKYVGGSGVLCGQTKGIMGQFTMDGILLNTYIGRKALVDAGFGASRPYAVNMGKAKTCKGFVFKRLPENYNPVIGKKYDFSSDVFNTP